MISVLLATAQAAEIGKDLHLGVGGATGDVYLAATGKYWLSQRFAASGYLGTSFLVQRLRLNAELELLRLTHFDAGGLDLYVLAGVDAGFVTAYGAQPDVGFGGGAGVSLKFDKFPGEAFLDAGAGGYPVCAPAWLAYCVVQPRIDAGFRWYIQ